MTFLIQGRPGVNGYKGEKGEPSGGAGFGFPVSAIIITDLASENNQGRGIYRLKEGFVRV